MFRYNEGGEIIEIVIRESSGAKIESYKFHISDEQRTKQIMNIIRKKYGLKDLKKKQDKDIDWLKKKSW